MSSSKLVNGGDILSGVVENYRKGIGPELWRTHSRHFDAFEVGPGYVAIIGAPPKAGKTALSMQLVADTLTRNADLQAYICNCELSPVAIMSRLLARYSSIPMKEIRFAEYQPKNAGYLESGVERMKEFADRLIFYQGPFALDCIQATFGEHGAGAGLLVIDYLQRLRLNSQDSGDDRRVELENVMSAMRGLADAGLGVIGISAVARQKGQGGSDYAGISLASLRGSSELEYGADSIWLLHTGSETPKLDNDKPHPENMVVLGCAANRHGDAVNIPLLFDKQRMTFHVLEV